MEIHCNYDKLIRTNQIKENPKNHIIHPYNDALVDRLAAIIAYQGLRRCPVISNLSGLLVTGHATVAALKKLEWDEVPVDLQDFESEDQEMAHLVADNALNDWRSLNFSALNKEILNLGPMNLDLLGLKDFVVEPLEKIKLKTEEEIKDQIKNFTITCPKCGYEFSKD